MNNENDVFDIVNGKVIPHKKHPYITGYYVYYCEYCRKDTTDGNLICDICCQAIQDKLDSRGQDKPLFPLEINGKVFYKRLLKFKESCHSANYKSPLNYQHEKIFQV
jgi:hypothetical protein